MTLTIVTTAGATDANSYCSLAEAEAYAATVVDSTVWVAKTDEQKKAAIIQAARWMNTFQWVGMRSSQTQAMAWPRCEQYTVRFDGLITDGTGYLLDQDGYQVASDTIPVFIKNANADLAMRQVSEDWTKGMGSVTTDSMKVGTIQQGRKTYRSIPASTLAYIRFFLLVQATGGRLVRG